jgi:adenosine deaminase
MRQFGVALVVVVALLAGVAAQAPSSSLEAATARRLAALRGNAGLLQAFLREMPKGGDLHNHLSGSIYAESFIRWSVDDNLCLATAVMAIVAAPCDATAGKPLLADAVRDAAVYGQVVDSLSMRNWNPQVNGHDHFFAAFAKFGPLPGRLGDMLAEVASRAAAEHVTYLELMLGVDGGAANRAAMTTGWDSDLAALRTKLLAAGLREQAIAGAKQRLDSAEARKNDLLQCGTPQADAGCTVTIRYTQQVLRASAPQFAFAQALAGLEVAAVDPRVVAINPVQPEDDRVAIADFTLQMRMFGYLHSIYPSTGITMHAGELADGLVPPEALRFHVRQSIEIGHARRIGHGVSVLSEDDTTALLRDMASRRVLVEIALTSNDVILGVRGARHPLKTYLQYGVPVALVTDDAGVSRSTHTREFQKAVEDHGLDYPTLKRMVRNSIEYAFVDAATKARLTAELDLSLRAFERRQSRLAVTRP